MDYSKSGDQSFTDPNLSRSVPIQIQYQDWCILYLLCVC